MRYEHITLVDENDHIIGYGEKYEVHRRALLHRAFSIFVYDVDTKKVLIQKRAQGKYHSAGLWSNACCSHPRMNESMNHALARCFEEELGIVPDVENMIPCGTFIYLARFDALYEHELDHVYLYLVGEGKNEKLPAIIPFDEKEVAEVQWISMEEIEELRSTNPKMFSAWFFKAFDKMKQKLAEE